MNIFGYHIEADLFWEIVAIIAAVSGLLISLFAWIYPRRAKTKESKGITPRLLTYIGSILVSLGLAIAILAWIFPPSPKLNADNEQRVQLIEKKVEEANENIKRIKEHLGIPIYVDGLPSADSPVFDTFAKGSKLMTEYKWDEAINEFKQVTKEAKGSELVNLYNLIGFCYYKLGELDLAIVNYSRSLMLAREFNYKQGEAENLGNLGLIFRDKGDLDEAMSYFSTALELNKKLGKKDGMALQLSNIGSVFEAKNDKEEALRYYEDALRIYAEIGAQKEFETTKENIKKLKGE